MKIKQLIKVLLLGSAFFLCKNLYAQNENQNLSVGKYEIKTQSINENEFSWKLLVFDDNKKSKVIYEADKKNPCSTGEFLEMQVKKQGQYEIVFVSHHSGGEGIPQLSLLIFVVNPKNNQTTLKIIEQSVISWELTHLHPDNKNNYFDIVFTEYTYYQLKLPDFCKPDDFVMYFEASIMPKFLYWNPKINQFEEEKDEMFHEVMMKNYGRYLERKFQQSKNKKTLIDYLHLFFVSFSSDREKEFNWYLHKNNPITEYYCNQTYETIKVNVKDFLKKYKEQLLFDKEVDKK
jgi:hypothetical protein